ncbi:MAG: trypsin-like serine protease [Actinomycetota bacterium]
MPPGLPGIPPGSKRVPAGRGRTGNTQRGLAVLAPAAGSALPAATAAGSATRIVGGHEVDPPGAFPVVAARVFPGWDAYAGMLCGGSGSAPEWVLTAAHCVAGDSLSEVDVVVARHDLRTGRGERIPAGAFAVHPGCESRRPTKHAVPVRLSRPVAYAPAVLLADVTWDPPGRWLTVAVWGDTQSRQRHPHAR